MSREANGGGMELLRHGVAVALAAIFIYAAWSKILDPEKFALQLKYYKLYPLWSLNALALLVPWWEVAAGVGLLIPTLRKGASLLVTGLTVGFLISVSQALVRGLDIECGCFGQGSGKIGWLVLGLDVVLLAASIFLLMAPDRAPIRGDVKASTAPA